MGTLGPGDLTVFFLGLATLLGLAHALAEGRGGWVSRW